MFRVVQDRERWFQIVMGQKFEFDEATSECPSSNALRQFTALRSGGFRSSVRLSYGPAAFSSRGGIGNASDKAEGRQSARMSRVRLAPPPALGGAGPSVFAA